MNSDAEIGVSGEYDESFLEAVYDIILDKDKINPRRFILFTDDEQTKSFFSNRESIDVERRCFYEYNKAIERLEENADKIREFYGR